MIEAGDKKDKPLQKIQLHFIFILLFIKIFRILNQSLLVILDYLIHIIFSQDKEENIFQKHKKRKYIH